MITTMTLEAPAYSKAVFFRHAVNITTA